MVRDVAGINRFAMQWGGLLALLAHPSYYLVWTVLLPQPYDNLFLRLCAAVLGIPLIFCQYWPQRLQRYLLPYWHVFLIFVLPFICSFLAIKNDFSTMWMMTEVMVIFVMSLCIDSPLLLLCDVLLGVMLATIAAVCSTPEPIILSHTEEANIALLPIVMACSMVFSYSKRLSNLHIEKNMVLQGLAGSIAHEMRNPLSQIKSSLDGIERNFPEPGTTTPMIGLPRLNSLYEYVNIGASAIKRGLQVIAMILDEVKDKPIDPQMFIYLHAAQTTQKAIAEYGYETEGERHKITLEVKRNFVFKGDETLCLFVLFNLIKNALYYFKVTPQAKITITINQPRIIVRDTGPGIPRERMQHLFDAFQTSGKTGGTGLGLAYCKRVMQAFGGDIRCHSVVGEYTEFILDFPEVSAQTWQHYQNSVIARIRPLLVGKRVLVVDDDETIRSATQVILGDFGIQVDQAENGRTALAQLARSHYDLIILDLNMPVLDGYATAERIRAGTISGYAQIPIVAYTTEVAYMAQVKTQKIGVNAFVSKPCEPLVLLQALEQALLQTVPHTPKQTPHSLLKNRTILIADDSDTNRELLKSTFLEFGMHTLEAAHGTAALELLNTHPDCDAILLDMHMPGLDGIETTRLVRSKDHAYRAIPIIMMTGDTDEKTMNLAFSAGIDDYIIKPIKTNSLLEKLAALRVSKKSTQSINLFDLARLDLFKQKGIFKSGTDNSFVRQTHEWLVTLEQSVHSNDMKMVQDALHFLKGSSYTIGAHAFADLVQYYEKQTNKGQLPEEKDWLDNIKTLHAQTLSALQAHFS
jgi:two-component system CAI-1 autoinducer sensor kinase/phosphatase CqsS